MALVLRVDNFVQNELKSCNNYNIFDITLANLNYFSRLTIQINLNNQSSSHEST